MPQESKDILKELRTSRGLSMRDVATGADIQYTLYTKYEYGERELGISSVRKLASFYGVSADVIIGLAPLPEPDDERVAQLSLGNFLEVYHKFPIEQRLVIVEKMLELVKQQEKRLKRREISEQQYAQEVRTIFVTFYKDPVSAGPGADLSGESETPDSIEVVETPISRKADFAVRVKGDSMEPDFENGDIALVVHEADINIGDVGVFQMNGEGYIKEYGDKILISRNPKYEPIPIVPPLYRAGKVIGKAEIPPKK